jgi:hypothetical protein
MLGSFLKSELAQKLRALLSTPERPVTDEELLALTPREIKELVQDT